MNLVETVFLMTNKKNEFKNIHFEFEFDCKILKYLYFQFEPL